MYKKKNNNRVDDKKTIERKTITVTAVARVYYNESNLITSCTHQTHIT